MARARDIPRWRRWIRRGVWGLLGTLLVLAALLAGLLLSLRLEAVQDRLVPFALEQLRPTLPGLQVGSLRGTVTGDVVLTGVELRDRFGGRAVAAERVELRYDLWALLRREVRVISARIVAPRVWLRKTPGGGVNLAELVVPGPAEPEPEAPTEPTRLRVAVQRLSLERGGFTLDRAMGGPLSVRGLALDLGAGLSLGDGDLAAAVQRLVLRAATVTLPDGRTLAASLGGDMGVDASRVHGQLKLGVEARAEQRSATLLLRVLGTMAAPQVQIDLKLPGDGVVALQAKAALPDWKLGRYSARLSASGIDPAALWPGLPPGGMGLELSASGKGVPLQPGSTAEATVSSAGAKLMQYALQRLNLRATLTGDRWKVEDLRARAYGADLQVRGRGDLKQVTASTVRLTAPALGRLPLPPGVPRLAGSATLTASASGPFTGPFKGSARLGAAAIAVDRVRLGGLDLSLSAAGLPARPSGKLALTLRRLDPGQDDLRVDSASLSASGSLSRLLVDVKAAGPSLGLDLGAGLSLVKKRLDLDLSRLALSFKGKRLALTNRPGARLVPGKTVQLGPTRLKLLGGKVALRGEVKLKGHPRLVLGLRARGVRPLAGRPAVDATVEARVGRRALTARATVDAGARVELRASVPVRHRKGALVPGLQLDGPVQLRLRAPNLRLATLRRWAPALPPLAGAVGLDLKADGTLSAPRGNLRLSLRKLGVGGLQRISGGISVELLAAAAALSADLKHQGEPLLDMELKADVGAAALRASRKRLLAALERAPVSGRVALTAASLEALSKAVPDLSGRLEGKALLHLLLTGTALRPEAKLGFDSSGVKVDGEPLPGVNGTVSLATGASHVRSELSLRLASAPLVDARASILAGPRELLLHGVGQARYSGRVTVGGVSLARLFRGHSRLGR